MLPLSLSDSLIPQIKVSPATEERQRNKRKTNIDTIK